MLKRTLFFSLMLFILGCKDNATALQKSDSIVAFGDSLTYGYGASPEESYPSVLSDITGYKIINAGVNGDTASNGRTRIKEVVNDYKPKAVLLSIGGNDMLRQDSKNLERNLNQIVSYLKSKNILVIIVAQPRPNVLVISNPAIQLEDASVFETVAKKQDVIILNDIFTKYFNKTEYKSDLIHLNANGYRLVAKDIAENLKDENILSF